MSRSKPSKPLRPSSWRPRVMGLAAALATLLACGLAWAFPVEMQVVSKVSQGKSPKMLFHANADAQQTTIELERSDGKKFTFSLGTLQPGEEKEIRLDGSVGRYRYKGRMAATVDGEKLTSPVSFSTVVAPPLSITVNRQDLDLEKHTLRFRASRPVTTATLSVIGIDGAPINQEVHDVSHSAADQLISLSFFPVDRDDLLRLELRVEDGDGFYRALSLTPWSVRIPHQEVLFSTNSARIEEDQEPKLEDSLEEIRRALTRYRQIEGVQLFIAGHTDTRGASTHNRDLSRRRAQAIAAWFVRRKVGILVYYEGFGESLLKVATEDEVDEPQNRRVDYILSVERPALSGGAWRRLN